MEVELPNYVLVNPMAARTILVTGATGQQGRAFIRALRPKTGESISENDQPAFHTLALTRNANTPNAQNLATEKHVTIIEGNLDSAESIRKIFEDAKEKGGIWGVFCVLAFPGLGANADGEERQGKTVADLAFEYGVSCFVLSTLERGGEKDDDKWTLDRLSKVRIEQHVRELGSKGLSWTFLRPGFFMENYDGTIGSITVSVMKNGLKPTTKLYLIAVEDIGKVAAGVFRDSERYKFKVLSVVGDILTMSEQEEAFKQATGRSMPSIPGFLAKTLMVINGHTRKLVKDMERIYEIHVNGENPDAETELSATRAACPQMTTFRAWAEQRKNKSSERKENWNQVTIGRLITGKQ